MKQLLNQVKDAWRNEELTNSVSTFQAFCGVLRMDRLPEFLSANNFRGIQDWSEQPLPSDGQALQANILERSNVSSSLFSHNVTNLLAPTPSTHEDTACGLDRKAARRLYCV
jgi:hypothetical protein